MILRNGHVHPSDSTSRIDRDYPWLLGLFRPTDIRMARFPVAALHASSDATR